MEADEVQHKTALALEQVGGEHCAGYRLEVSELADPKMGQHLEHTCAIARAYSEQFQLGKPC